MLGKRKRLTISFLRAHLPMQVHRRGLRILVPGKRYQIRQAGFFRSADLTDGRMP